MRTRVLLALLTVLPGLLGAEDDRAQAIFKKAVRAQGNVARNQIIDIRVIFDGQIEDQGTQHVKRSYWYRTKDRSFRVLTKAPIARKAGSERGVLGEAGYWKRTAGGIVDLSKGNRDHRKSIRTIDKDRREFERMLRMLLLSRLDDGKSRFRLVAEEPERIEKDAPYNAGQILGKDRRTHTYHVVDVAREKELTLRLYVDTADAKVRKVVQYDPGRPEDPRRYYYFGAFKKHDRLGLTLPRLLSAHVGRPVDRKTKGKTGRAHGRLEVHVNGGLKKANLRPD